MNMFIFDFWMKHIHITHHVYLYVYIYIYTQPYGNLQAFSSKLQTPCFGLLLHLDSRFTHPPVKKKKPQP